MTDWQTLTKQMLNIKIFHWKHLNSCLLMLLTTIQLYKMIVSFNIFIFPTKFSLKFHRFSIRIFFHFSWKLFQSKTSVDFVFNITSRRGMRWKITRKLEVWWIRRIFLKTWELLLVEIATTTYNKFSNGKHKGQPFPLCL